MAVGSCAGSLSIPAEKVTLHAGGKIDVFMTEESAHNSTRLVPVYPLPHSSRSSVLKHTATSPDRATVTYIAKHPGRAMLITHGLCNGPGVIEQHWGDCPFLDVTVIP
jgi:hypothetical protein